MIEPKVCAWCKGEIPANLRADAVCCSTRCRQARHRFNTSVGTSVAVGRGERLRLAYADPPYPGLSKRYYGDHPDFAGEVDHQALIDSLVTFDGWALSTSARALPEILAMCPPGVHVAAWHRGDRGGRSFGPLNAWEPVIYAGGRLGLTDPSRSARADASQPCERDASRGAGVAVAVVLDVDDDAFEVQPRRVDSLVYTSRPRLTDPDRVVGAKPATFCRWIFDLLGAEPGDDFTDIFAGSGGVMRAWSTFAGSTDRNAA